MSIYTEPSRYNWMFSIIAARATRAELGRDRRLIFSLNYTDADFAQVADRFVTAAEKMKQDGWCWRDAFPHQQNHPPADSEEILTRAFSR